MLCCTRVLISPQPHQGGNKLGSMSGARMISTTSRRKLSSSSSHPGRNISLFPSCRSKELSAPLYFLKAWYPKENVLSRYCWNFQLVYDCSFDQGSFPRMCTGFPSFLFLLLLPLLFFSLAPIQCSTLQLFLLLKSFHWPQFFGYSNFRSSNQTEHKRKN